MSVREWLNGHPKVASCLVGGIAVIALVGIAYEIASGRRGYPSKAPDFYFSDDDGKTFFVDSSENYAPFDHHGREADHAYVFQCSGKKFVGILERYLPDVKQKLSSGSHLTPEMVKYGREMKHPGDPAWTRTGDLATDTRLETVLCPDGSGTALEEVEP